MKKLLVSFSGGLFLLGVWSVIVVATSQDFAHEGPNSIWFSPVDAWSGVVIDTGWPAAAASLSPALGVLVGAAMLLGPFHLALSVAVYLSVALMRPKMPVRNLR